MLLGEWRGRVGQEHRHGFSIPQGRIQEQSSPSKGLTAAKPWTNSRTIGCPTTGQIGQGAQQRRGLLMRPKRASSWKSQRHRR
jgi:hypothetical protein